MCSLWINKSIIVKILKNLLAEISIINKIWPRKDGTFFHICLHPIIAAHLHTLFFFVLLHARNHAYLHSYIHTYLQACIFATTHTSIIFYLQTYVHASNKTIMVSYMDNWILVYLDILLLAYLHIYAYLFTCKLAYLQN